ncbi:DUF58 domain-containing protein [Mycolicibacterium sediminis]|uniref:DUF58 domain-containing protein n=1 Tax=Mycolicibacterium sediminis TaxID=1286180 RepID=A0A7I7QNE9_9MYCO|nr:DUF58 domain-containing protein [Mycolicibacterium sediminis]BBY27540.1 hypothetical protein MSEDJ_16360 [Mycolicibacterium sediminis]
MGEILNRVRTQLDFDPRSVGMRMRSRKVLEGGHTSLQFGRSDDFVDLREYVAGDDVRDIDWRASARNTHLVVRRYVAEKAQEFLLVADVGANMLALAPSGERKRELAVYALGAVGLVACAQSDKISLVYGDERGSSIEPGKMGEDHLEQVLNLVNDADIEIGTPSNVVKQLEFVAANLDKRYAVYVVCDQPEVTPELEQAAMAVRSRNAIHWILVEDLDVIGRPDGADEVIDVSTARALVAPPLLGAKVLDAYRRAEAARHAQWQQFTARLGSPCVRIASIRDVGPALTALAQQEGRRA